MLRTKNSASCVESSRNPRVWCVVPILEIFCKSVEPFPLQITQKKIADKHIHTDIIYLHRDRKPENNRAVQQFCIVLSCARHKTHLQLQLGASLANIVCSERRLVTDLDYGTVCQLLLVQMVCFCGGPVRKKTCPADKPIVTYDLVPGLEKFRKGFQFFQVTMYEDRTQYYDSEIHEVYLIHDAPFPLPHHLQPCADYSIQL